MSNHKPVSKHPPRKKGHAAPAWWKSPVLWVIGILVVAAGAMAVIILGSQPAVDEDFEPEVTGAPSMVVDNDTQNYGNVSFGQPVNAVFTLRNVGDEPLRILGEPSVELVRGC